MRSHRFECECDACYRKFMDNINNFDEGALLRMKRECEQLAEANSKIAKLEQENRDADLLLGDTWRDVISTMHGNGGSVESALRQQLHNLSANLRIANAKIAELEQSATKLEEVLSVVQSSLMEHGDCKSYLRYSSGLPMACTACMARIKLSEMVSEWKGPVVKLAAAFAAKEE